MFSRQVSRVGRSVRQLALASLSQAVCLLLAATFVGGYLVVSFLTSVVGGEPSYSPGRYGAPSYVPGRYWFFEVPLTVLLCAAVLVVPGLALLHRWASWELGRSGRYLGRRVPPLAPLPALRVRIRARGLFTEAGARRTLGWFCAELTVGVLFAALALAPFVALFDVAYTTWHFLPQFGTSPTTFLLAVSERLAGWPPYDVFGGHPVLLVGFMGAELLLGLTGLVVGLPVLADLRAALTVRLVGGSRVSELERRVGELAETRAGAVDAHTAELRRIERDLHDGIQAQLVNVSMRIGMAERRLADEPAAVGALLANARGGAEDAMVELRGVLRSMYPPVLADRGLRGAIAALASRCATATTVDAPELDDVPAPVEAAAYFVVAEALTNVTKHSAASHADVTLRREPQSLVVEVTDNGLGGVDEEAGTGVVGMRRRVAALDGWVEVRSPQGGPTVVIAELPCG